MKRIPAILLALCAVFSCTTAQNEPTEPVQPSEENKAITGDVIITTYTRAVITGQTVLGDKIPADTKFGVLYAKNSGVLYGSASEIDAKDFDQDFNYTLTVSNLEPETKYYYRSFVFLNGDVIYGETKSFETVSLEEVVETDTAIVKTNDVTLSAVLDLEDFPYSGSAYYGFVWSDDPDMESYNSIDSDKLTDSTFSVTMHLKDIGQYYYKAWAFFGKKNYFGEQKTFTINNQIIDVYGVQIDPAWYTMKIGQIDTVIVNATILPSNATNQDVVWSVDDEGIVNITPDGHSCTVTALAPGDARVRVTTVDGDISIYSLITVNPADIIPESVVISPDSVSVCVGETSQLSAAVYPENATSKEVTWYSSDESVAKVGMNGVVKGFGVGTATITAITVLGGKTASCTVNVYDWRKLDLKDCLFSTNAMMQYVSQDSSCDQYGLNGDHNWFMPITQDQIDARTTTFGPYSNMWDEDDETCWHSNLDWGQTYSSWGYRDGATPGAKTLAYLTVTFPDNYTTVQLKVTANTNTAGKCFSKSWSRTVEGTPYSYSVDGFLLYWSSDGEEFVLYEDEEITAGKVSCPGYGGNAAVTLKATAEMPSIAAIKITSQMNPADEDPDGANDWTGTENAFGIAEMEIIVSY